MKSALDTLLQALHWNVYPISCVCEMFSETTSICRVLAGNPYMHKAVWAVPGKCGQYWREKVWMGISYKLFCAGKSRFGLHKPGYHSIQ